MPPTVASRSAGIGTAPDRRQSTRQGRTTVRPSNYYARSFAGRLANGMEQTPEASNNAGGFCPALTHFSQAVDAFPKELIKHFSMFKEVEAKMHDPERVLKGLLDEIAQMPVPTRAEQRENIPNGTSVDNKQIFPENFNELPPEEQAALKKRQTFFRLRYLITSMLPTLDEKLVVLNGAKATKDKSLMRMDLSYARLDEEISEEARYGSLSHWAYADKEEKKKGGPSQERQRREVVSANNLAAAAQHVHDVDSIAAKSEARREAMLANKRSRNQHIDSDFDDRPPAKKTQKRKTVAADGTGNDARNVGLGIISNGVAQHGKRKKTEKALAAAAAAAAAAIAAPPMERSLSGALKAAGGGRGGTSPRATPGAEGGSGTGKRKPRAAPAPARKNALPAYSPPPASSPITSTFSLPKAVIANTERPVGSRGRKNSTATSVASAAPEPPTAARRPSVSQAAPQASGSNAIAELEQAAGINRDDTSTKGASTPKETTELPTFESIAGTTLKHEEVEQQEPESMDIDAPVPAPVATRTGRASKTATPVVGSFPEIPMARSRSTRKANNGNGNSNASSENNSTTTGAVSKRGHKKNVPSTTTAVAQPPATEPTPAVKSNVQSRASSVAPESEYPEADSEEAEEAEADGEDEPLYCYCNQVSFGNMIACDNDSCPREWFHLPCVHLERAPSGRSKWFCSVECENIHKESRKAKGGRPGSSRQ